VHGGGNDRDGVRDGEDADDLEDLPESSKGEYDATGKKQVVETIDDVIDAVGEVAADEVGIHKF
jgi:hypothetical protein